MVMAKGVSALQAPEISVAEKRQLAVFAALLKESDLDRVNGSMRTALNEDANFYGTSASLQSRTPPLLDDNGLLFGIPYLVIGLFLAFGAHGASRRRKRQLAENAAETPPGSGSSAH